MTYQQKIYGAGLRAGEAIGRRQENARVLGVIRAAESQARQDSIDGAAAAIGATIGHLLLAAWEQRKLRRQEQDGSAVA
ncbi:hypothetical protein ACI3KS_12285 [Microbacterium sp. ZW T5_45]|uniref:hypothetical protein n=1 Tax=Microbacterium sp. ZW T5_45 TaxID=3378080 RepID=UPI003852391B